MTASGPTTAPASTDTWSPIQQGAIRAAVGETRERLPTQIPGLISFTRTREGVSARGIQAMSAANQLA
jgi:hypothetical protein